jgi:hypothetical protein
MQLTRHVNVLLLGVALAAMGSVAAGQPATFTGTIGDTMCGVTHMVKGDDAKCTRACVKGGAAYALIVNDKFYTLKGNEKISAALDKLAGQKVTVSGTRTDDTIEVASVAPAK